MCQELWDDMRNDQNFLSTVITGQETWVTVTIQKPNSSPICGRAHPLHVGRERDKSSRTSKAC